MKKYLEGKSGFWWLFLKEIILMFSNEKSLLSSKRAERFVMFNIAMWTIIGYVKRNWDTITVDQLSIITGILLVGGAWNAVQIRKDQTMTIPDSKITDTAQ